MSDEHTKLRNAAERRFIGQRIRLYRRASNITQQQLGAKTGIEQTDINKYENGKRAFGPETLQTIAQALDVTVRELLELHPAATTVMGTFMARLSCAIGEDLRDLPYEMWRPMIAPACLPKTVEVCAETLVELDQFSSGKDFSLLLPDLQILIELLETACALSQTSEAKQCYTIAHLKAWHWHCFTDHQASVLAGRAPHLNAIKKLMSDSEPDQDMTEKYCAFEGDSLKIAAGNDAALNNVALDILTGGLDLVEGQIHSVAQYQIIRSLLIATAASARSNAIFDKTNNRAEAALQRVRYSHRKVAHTYDGLSDGNATMFKKTNNSCYKFAALKYYQLALDEDAAADKAGEPRDIELSLRLRGLVIKLSRNGIVGPLQATGLNLEEFLLRELKSAVRAGSERIVGNYANDLRKLRQPK